MKKVLKKLLSAMLSIALVAGMVNLVPMEVSAEGTNITPVATESEDLVFKASELKYEWGSCTQETTTAEQVQLGFAAQYNQAVFTLTDYAKVDLSKCKSVTFCVSEQSGPVAFKLIDDSYAEISSFTKYSQSGQTLYTYDVTGMTNIVTQVGLMLDVDITDQTFVFDGVYFDMMSEEELNPDQGSENITPVGSSEDFSYTGDKLANYYHSDDVTCTLNGTQWNVVFGSQYSQTQLWFPSEIDLTNAKSVTFAISEQNCVLALKVHTDNDGSDAEIVKYNCSDSADGLYTIDLSAYTSTASKVTVMLNTATTDPTCVIDGVYFDMMSEAELNPDQGDDTATNLTPEATSSEDFSYTGDELSVWWENATSEAKDTQWEITFAEAYKQTKFGLPSAIDLTNAKSVTFAVSDQNCVLAFKVHTDKDGSDAEIVQYNCSGKNLYTIDLSAYSSTASAVAVMLNNVTTEEGASSTCVFDGVYFDMMNAEEIEAATPVVDETANITPAAASAEDKAFKGSELTGVNAGATAELGGPNSDEWKITFTGKWSAWTLQLPEAIDLSMCNSVTFHVSEQTGPLSFKLFKTVDGTVTEITDLTKYGQTGATQYTYTFSGREEVITHVGVMLGDDLSAQKCSIDGVSFDMMTEQLETYTINYTADQLTLGTSNAQSAQITGGKLVVQYSALNQQTKFVLPSAVNFGKCIAITVKVSAQEGPVNFYAYSDGANVDTFSYKVGSDSYTLTPTAEVKVDTIGVQTGGSEFTTGANITIDSITFLMEGKEPQPLPEDTDGDGQVTVDSTFFVEVEASAGVTVEVKEVGGQTVSEISFTEVGDYVDFEIPDTVDIAHLAKIAFDMEVVSSVATQSLEGETIEGIEISLLDADKNVLVTGNLDVLNVNGNTKAKYIRVTTIVADQNLQLTTITFEMDMTIVGDIVKNGYFEDTDVSMWQSDPNVDSVTRVDNGSTFIDGQTFTAYGEIESRTSNYTCFQQDITSRVTPGKYYAITFWAKLSDDYADAPASKRTITVNPYYLDASRDAKYGTVPMAGAVNTVCEVGQWTKIVAMMQVPAGSTGFILRLMEQGLDYGLGDGVKGSYAIAGVSMQETTAFVATTGGSSASNGSKFVDTREVKFSQRYAMDEVAVDWASAIVASENGVMTLNFAKQYDEARFKLPRTYDASEMVSLKVDVSSTNVPLAIKLYNKGNMVGVTYYNTIYENGQTFTIYPNMSGEIDGFGVMALKIPTEDCYATITSVQINCVEEPDPLPVRSTIVANGDFSNTDLSDWHASYWGQSDGVSMFHEVSSKPFGDGTTNYASYSKRTSPYQCFAQDITGYVEQNEIYTFSFWAKLSDDYIGAPESQRVVQFAPYTVDKAGVADYNPKLDGTYMQVLEPGIWTKFEGTYKVTNANEISTVVIRILEQGTNYGQGDCVLGGYSIADVKMDLYVPDPPSIDEDVPNLDETLMSVFGDDFIVGNSLTVDGIDDLGTSMLLNKHFNAITLGNELKPDALFGYSNSQHTKLQTITFNGQELVVPTLDFSRAEMVLDKIVKWNKENPDHQFKVRGHVLVWHAQTPEWFFRENYEVGQNADGSENYVTPEVMNQRLEWYIKTVLEHFTGEDSEYKDMFYGWDVVNEAVSDGSGSYRTDKIANGEQPSDDTHGSNSSWWAVYGSNEYIIKAFQFANKYAPADVELYYNDYNECNETKVKGIVKLLEDVLAAEGTRIDAMGMQAHYNLMNPSVKMFENAIRAYAAVVGNVQITEFDMKASRDLSSEKNLMDEYAEQGQRYLALYEALKKLDAEEGVNITGITFWGVSDKDSWLQSSSNVGGGSDGTMTQCPLLFDSNYKVKPSFWAFVDYTVVDPTYGQEPEVLPDENSPLGEVDTDVKEEVKEDTNAQGDTEQNTDASGSVVTQQPKKTNAVPFVVAGAVVVLAGAGASVWFLKKKK